ncbi:hypothetical protein WJM97_10200 [Okeanomitos corallinicola TIOX110]|uniref:Uncharacterized protein n=1 Tax=Okeanomitos corallinicola TIOX110 TaxID=3133117 RepID=A0ABZ2V0E1_9CYAN
MTVRRRYKFMSMAIAKLCYQNTGIKNIEIENTGIIDVNNG